MRWASGMPRAPSPSRAPPRATPPPTDIDRYVRSRYRIYRGSEQGWNELLARVVAGERAPPAGFVKSIPHALTPPEAALQVVDDHDPASLSFADWALVLRHRDATPANKTAAEKVWKVITDKQQGGGTRLKIPVKVISADTRHHRGGDHRRGPGGQHRRPADCHGPSAGAAARGRRQDLDRRHPERLPAAALPVHDDARPSLPRNRCRWRAAPAPIPGRRSARATTGRPAALRRDGGRKTYGNACTRLQRSRGRDPGGRRLSLKMAAGGACQEAWD